MAIGLVGRKAGMTRVFTDAGETVPVTVIEVLPNRVTQVKSQDKDGYRAVQVTYGNRRPQLYSKAVAGHYAKATVAPGKALVEFRLTEKEGADLKAGIQLGRQSLQPQRLGLLRELGGRAAGQCTFLVRLCLHGECRRCACLWR